MRTLILIALLTGLPLVGARAQVRYERLVHPEKEPGHWLTYSGDYRSHRFSTLDEITSDNVAQLTPVWMYQLPAAGVFETTPLVVDDLMYVTEPPSSVTALDVRTGRPLWKWQPVIPEKVLNIGFPQTNRGVAVLDDTLFIGTLDGFVVALDAASGAVRWKTHMGENETGHAITAAPLAIEGKVIVGVSGGEAGIRGYLDAYDAVTGDRLWRFYTVPSPGEPGHDTWGGDSWKTGGGATWLTGSYDPALNLLYWGTGNPAPDWNGDVRPGDNLYTCSVVALDADSGELEWYFQFTPHDVHDWDANQIPILFDATVDGRPRKLIGMANRNAFYYLLDRETGEFLRGAPYAKQTWAKGLDETGRPIVIPDTEPTIEGNLVYPSLRGSTNWYSPSYSPETGLLYVPVSEMGAYYFKGEAVYRPGHRFTAGGERRLSGDQAYGAICAIDVRTAEVKWEFRQHTPPNGGVLSTAGGLVFAGANEGNFFALDADTGEPLWDFQTGGRVRANPISYAVDGKQYIAIASGYALFVFGL